MALRMSKFTQTLNSGRLVVMAECVPPRGSDSESIRRFSAALPSNLDAVVVADNPDAIRSSALSAAYLLRREGHSSVVLSMATRDRNRIALMSDALGAAALGISAILCLSGDHQSMGICPQAAVANDLDSIQFTHALKGMILYGSGLGGNKLEHRLDLQVGCVAHPFLRPLELNLLGFKKKITAGADFLLTQAVFDVEAFSLWMDAVRAAGLDNRTAIIPSVLPLASVEKARELQRRRTYGPIGDDTIARLCQASNPAEEGARIASEIAMRLKRMPGVRGIHILYGGLESMAADVIKQAGLGAESLVGAA
jgi:methylenetetrahydrofolate reductase (NADPH)